ncbi:toll/interleukin-1 receptor domain-containing protein [Arthrobacter sp. AL12]|uniref:toll/interleukin-1 receptor domain-containing protein n=1 Tax=Arthrobacter sp. AL12 TaxID=3042241 RepID=UPI00249CDCE6|nr:toll/interleukin-1 receptor domain-containing protein [Arthrobacter sp. AL12]MDI3211800.1 toll/interleukin-1 receptor domain-containing protein [Arthrobacter sp. AL12]
MKVFISWSGEKAKDFALELRDWLPFVIHDLAPWVSDADIDSGTMSMQDIHRQLDQTKYGIICTTAENQAKPWINYEAGALWKSINHESRVVPLLIDLEMSDVQSPLRNFHSRIITHRSTRQAEVRKLIESLNKARATPINAAVLEESFLTQWPKMETIIDRIAKNNYAYKARMSDVDRKLEDIHQTVLKIAEEQRAAASTTIDSLDEVLDRKSTLAYGSFSEQTAGLRAKLEAVANSSLIARGFNNRVHVERVDSRNYVVYSADLLPDEVKRALSDAAKAVAHPVNFEYLLTMSDEPDEDPTHL